jgi:hypothetical protein
MVTLHSSSSSDSVLPLSLSSHLFIDTSALLHANNVNHPVNTAPNTMYTTSTSSLSSPDPSAIPHISDLVAAVLTKIIDGNRSFFLQNVSFFSPYFSFVADQDSSRLLVLGFFLFLSVPFL